MATEIKKAQTGAERLRKSNDKKKAAKLRQISVWVVDQRGVNLHDEKSEADRIRDYAAKQPVTKAILKTL